MTPATFVGVDVGTSVTKATLWDDAGTTLASVGRPTPRRHPAPGRTEHDTDAVVAGAAAAVAELVAATGASRPVLLSVTGQGDGCWLVDAEGRATAPAISWMDGRAAAIVDRWATDGSAAAVYHANGNAVFPGCMAAVLAWLDRHEPSRLSDSATAGYCKDVVFQRLTGVRATDPSDASLPFGRPDGSGYEPDLLAVCGLTDRADLLAPVAAPLPIAPLHAEGARLTGVAPGTPVTSGPFDLASSPLGAGVRRRGDGLLIIGTTLACEVLVDRIDTDPVGADPVGAGGDIAGMHLSTGTPGRWVRVLPAMAGCAALDWVLATVGLTSADVSAAIQRSCVGAGGVDALPYLAPSGERAPFLDSSVTGQFHGLRLSTTRDDLVRAMCESIAFAARDCFSATAVTGELMVTGGGANSRPWLQIFADVLDRPLRRVHETVGARGAVVAALDALAADAGVGGGDGGGIDTEAWGGGGEVIEPSRRSASEYGALWERYQARRDAARSAARP